MWILLCAPNKIAGTPYNLVIFPCCPSVKIWKYVLRINLKLMVKVRIKPMTFKLLAQCSN